MQATADLGECAREVAATYARYCSHVRGLTSDPALRRMHGVKSPGQRKGPMFRRGARQGVTNGGAAAEEAPAQAPGAPFLASDPPV